MSPSFKLRVETLAVESFATVPIPVPLPTPKPLLTCMDTNCGNKLCCA